MSRPSSVLIPGWCCFSTICVVGALILSLACTRASKPEDAIFVYDLFVRTPSCQQIEQRLAALPLRSTVILSIEQGPEYLLDSRDGEERLTCALAWLKRHDHRVKAMLLQDPSFIERTSPAVHRLELLAQYTRRQPVAAAVIDVEPYGDPGWTCAPGERRRDVIRRYRALLRALRAAAGALPLETAAPWWLTQMSDVPEMHPAALFEDVSGMYLMLYADEGGPLIGGSADRIAERVPPDSAYFGQGPGHGRVYLGLATYETDSPESLNREIAALQRRYAKIPGFAGTAVFHAGSAYNVPLVRMLDGQVVDAGGQGVAGAEVQFAGIKAHTSGCGYFSFRGIETTAGELIVSSPGYEPQVRQVQIAPPGRETNIGAISLAHAH